MLFRNEYFRFDNNQQRRNGDSKLCINNLYFNYYFDFNKHIYLNFNIIYIYYRFHLYFNKHCVYLYYYSFYLYYRFHFYFNKHCIYVYYCFDVTFDKHINFDIFYVYYCFHLYFYDKRKLYPRLSKLDRFGNLQLHHTIGMRNWNHIYNNLNRRRGGRFRRSCRT